MVHGAGAHSAALWPLAWLVAQQGIDVAAVDLPLYGCTTSLTPEQVRYEDWVRLLVDLVRAEHDGRPLILFGASVAGMLACEVSTRSPHVAAVAATCLLDPRDWRARAHMTRFGTAGVLAGPLSALARGPMAGIPIPMAWVANLDRMSRDPGLSRLCATDPRGGGARVPLGFLASYMRYRHAPPQTIRTPVHLLHPDRDDWTPIELSLRVLRRIPAPTTVVTLEQCGHFPIEEPGLSDLVFALRELAVTLTHPDPH